MKKKLKRAIHRSERAYQSYLEHKKYFQALRIYRANQVAYELLNEFIFICEEAEIKLTEEYIFHLEDWFHQFEMEAENISLSDAFIFSRLDHSKAFPSQFKNILS